MKQPFEFRAFNSGKIYKVYSVQRLINLCRQYLEDACHHLRDGHIEEWLDYIGEPEAAQVARKNYNNAEEFCDKIEEFLDSRAILNTLEKAIEITLKEYEALREEIMQNFQSRTQLILLGLAAIFTLIGLALTPLTGLLTVEEITIKDINTPLVISIDKYPGISKDELEKETNINSIQIKTTAKEGLKIERETQSQTVLRAIIPSIIIFCWIVPLGSVYIVFRSIRISEGNIRIGEYITNVIECKIHQYFLEKVNITSQFKKAGRFSQYLYPLSWENYISETKKTSIDFEGGGIIYFLFLIIVSFSLAGGFILLNLDYTDKDLINGKVTINLFKIPLLLLPCFYMICIKCLRLGYSKSFHWIWSLVAFLIYCLAGGFILLNLDYIDKDLINDKVTINLFKILLLLLPCFYMICIKCLRLGYSKSFHWIWSLVSFLIYCCLLWKIYPFNLASLSATTQSLLAKILQILFEILPIIAFTCFLAHLFFEELLPLDTLRQRIVGYLDEDDAIKINYLQLNKFYEQIFYPRQDIKNQTKRKHNK